MKNIDDLKDYRLKYKRYYGIDFDKDFDVHHIDGDRNNNDINNLLVLPSKLHHQLHAHYNGLVLSFLDGFNLKNVVRLNNYALNDFTKLAEIAEEVAKWYKWKQCNYDNYLKDLIFIEKRH